MTDLSRPRVFSAADVTQHLGVFSSIVGDTHVLLGDHPAYTRDWLGRYGGVPLATVRPATHQQVAQLLAYCSAHSVPVVPQGGNTGLVGGGVPNFGELLLSLSRLSGVSDVDPDSGHVTALAGTPLSVLDDVVPGWECPVRIGSRHTATVGGAVATNAGGVRVVSHGHMRAHVLGVSAVLANGSVLSAMSDLVKDNTGYHYPSLFCGSEGTLGVVTQARVRLRRSPSVLTTVLIPVSTPADAYDLVTVLRGLVPVYAAEFMQGRWVRWLSENASVRVPFSTDDAGYVLVDLVASADRTADVLASAGVVRAAVASSRADRDLLWVLRERHPEIVNRLTGVPAKLDVSVPPRLWPVLYDRVAEGLSRATPDAQVILYGHFADGNLHVNASTAAGDSRVEDFVFAAVADLGGSVSAEHGVGVAKKPWVGLSRTCSQLAVDARLRDVFDPARIMNPAVLAGV